MAEHFIGKGLSLLIYDPEVHLSRLLGANRRFIEQHLPHIGAMIRGQIEEVIGESELLVVGIGPPAVSTALERLCRPEQIVLDLVNLPNRSKLQGRYEGLCW
jgi:GDP-mannose 6-dehydrogenase